MLKNTTLFVFIMTLTFVSMMDAKSSTQTSTNHLEYTEDTNYLKIRLRITGHYINRPAFCDSYPNSHDCDNPTIVPPTTPEIWYFVNDSQSELLKYVVRNSFGMLNIQPSPLTAFEKVQSDEVFSIRERAKLDWLQFESLYPKPTNSAGYKQYVMEDDCAAGGALESEDSPFDYFSNSVLRNKIKDDVLATQTTGGRAHQVGVSLGVFSYTTSWNTDGTLGTTHMPDGGTLVFSLLNVNGINQPLLHLDSSRTASSGRLSDFFAYDGPQREGVFKLKPGTHSTNNNCEAQEIEEAIESVSPTTFAGGEADMIEGASGGEYGFGDCENVTGLNATITYYVEYSVSTSGHTTFFYRTYTEFNDDGCV